MSKTRKICCAALGAALYFVASCSLKIPLFGHITVDCGYIVLMVMCVLSEKIGIMPAVVCGALGCALESMLMSPLGFSIGWFVMNIIVAAGVAWACKSSGNNVWAVMLAIPCCVFVGVMAKTGIECALYSIPIAVKMPKSLVAFAIDSLAMWIGYPIGVAVWSRFDNHPVVVKE